MSNVCELCGKQRVVGGRITRRGLAKYKGGIGMHVVKNVKRVFKPNVQAVRTKINGTVRRMRVCTACIRMNRVAKP
jgi:large subunit ribosomal protein L28